MKKSLLDLKNTITKAAQDYYTGNESITDAQFDSLIDELKIENPADELLNKVGWGYDINKVAGNKATHRYGTVGSLGKVHSIKEITGFDNTVVASSKIDGASCVAYFENGILIQALSRGDGTTGIDCTAKIRKIFEKYRLSLGTFTGGIRGEVAFTSDGWERYILNHPEAKFPRNIATGLFMRNEVSADLQYIDFITYKIMGSSTATDTTYSQILNVLQQFGFPVVEYAFLKLSETTDEDMSRLCESWKKYPTDGIVIQSYPVAASGKCLNYHDIAYKFKAEEKETTVIAIEWALSKNNIMVPVACIQPIELSGATVSKVTAFNYKYVRDNKLGAGARIVVRRSGLVIPDIVSVIEPSPYYNENSKNDIKCINNTIICDTIPIYCPVCGQPLHRGDVELLCVNSLCPNIDKARLSEWIQVIGIRDILGVGPAMKDTLLCELSVLGINTISELYDKWQDSYLQIIKNKFTPVAAGKVTQVLTNLLKPVTCAEVLLGLNIRNLGEVVCKKIEKYIYSAYIETPERKQNILSEIVTISGLGESVLSAVIGADTLLENIFQRVQVLPPEVESHNIFQITITGALSVPRKIFEQQCKVKHIALSDNIKDSKYLITNDPTSGSSKLKKANQLGITIISEAEFRNVYNV